jgi:hypothetical protein
MDEARPDSVFWVFMDPFQDAAQYVDAMIAGLIALALVHGPVCALLAEQKADAQLTQGKRDEAMKTYDDARKLAETYSVYRIWKSTLEKPDVEHQRMSRDDLASLRREWQRAHALEYSRGSTGNAARPPLPGGPPAHA